MKSRVQQHLSFANVASALALFLAITGGTTAIALSGKNSVDSGDIKNGNVRTRDLAGNAVTGKKVRELTLGIVPDAIHAENADKLGGLPDTNYQLGNGVDLAIAGTIDDDDVDPAETDLGSERLLIDCNAPPGQTALSVEDEAGGVTPTSAAPHDVWFDGDHQEITTSGGSTTPVDVDSEDSSTSLQIWSADDVVTDARINFTYDEGGDQCVVAILITQNLNLVGTASASARAGAARLSEPRTFGIDRR